MTIIKVFKEESNQTLKSFLISKIGNQYSSSKISKSIDDGNIKVNNKKTFWNYLLKENDEIKIYLNIRQEDNSFLKAKDELKILYEDTNIIIVNKPRGLVCQKDQNEKFDTLNNRIKKYLHTKNDSTYKTVHLCHRLDKYTTGVCIAGKTINVIKELNTLWNTDAIQKFYKCLAYGVFKKKKEILKDFIMLNEEKQIMEIDYNNLYNKEIITIYEVVNQYKDFAELIVELKTGKKHQIRVHLSSINHPILGDTKYNKIDNFDYKYPCLVSYKIKFNLPKTSNLNYLNNLNVVAEKTKFK